MHWFNIFSTRLILVTLGLSSVSSLLTPCSIPTSFIGTWLQPGLTDSITINNTWFSSKGVCVNGQANVKTKYIFYNEQIRCKRCILFIARHSNVFQYRESECFDADDESSRICGSITPDTVLYTLFRNNAQSISCPFDQSWYFKNHHQICQPQAFHHCFPSDTFQISYSHRCQSKQVRDVKATCFARFSDGNMNYVISRSVNQERFICFSYTKPRTDDKHFSPSEVYFSEDDTCRDLLTRESAIVLNILPNKHYPSTVSMPDWTQGTWLSTGVENSKTHTFHVNRSQLIMRRDNDRIVTYDLKFTRVLQRKRGHENSIRLRAKSLEQCSSRSSCVRFIYRSSAVIDLSIGFGEHGCRDYQIHYTLFKPTTQSDISCPQTGLYKSTNTYRSSVPISSCSTGLWTLAMGCERTNKSALLLSSSCHHELIPNVQVLTSTIGICLASWQSDHRFQRTLVSYEHNKAFCLIQPLKSRTASWIITRTSCTELDFLSIGVENSLRYFDTCDEQPSKSGALRRMSNLLFYLMIQVFICM